MNIDDLAIKSANTQRGGLVPSSTGLTPDALPEVQKNSFGRELKHRGTTKNALSGTGNDHSSASKTEDSHWGSPDKPGGLSIQLCKSEKKEFYIRYSS